MKKLLLIIIAFTFYSALDAQITIAEARALPEGTNVTVEGIVTNGSELGIIRYMQDATAGIAVYPGNGSVGNFPNDVQRGDIIQVSGPLKSFNELLEIDPVESYTVISSGNALPDPIMATPDDIREETEGQLMQISGVTFDDGCLLYTSPSPRDA